MPPLELPRSPLSSPSLLVVVTMIKIATKISAIESSKAIPKEIGLDKTKPARVFFPPFLQPQPEFVLRTLKFWETGKQFHQTLLPVNVHQYPRRGLITLLSQINVQSCLGGYIPNCDSPAVLQLA